MREREREKCRDWVATRSFLASTLGGESLCWPRRTKGLELKEQAKMKSSQFKQLKKTLCNFSMGFDAKSGHKAPT